MPTPSRRTIGLLAILAAPIAALLAALLIGFGTGWPELALLYALVLAGFLAIAWTRATSS
jgi:hypothetical protein